MPAFTAATGVPVEVQSLPWTAAHEKLLTAHAGGSLPDVFMLPGNWVNEFALVGSVAPVLDPALLADNFPSALRATQYCGQHYAVPWSLGTQVQFYRRDLIAAAGYAAPPLDWAEWRRMGQALKRRTPDAFLVLSYLNWPELLFTFLWQAGAYPLRDRDTRGNFDTPEFRAALGFYKSLFHEKLAPLALSTEIQDPVGAFAQGLFAIYPYDASLLLDFHRRASELPAANWGTARMPGPHGPAAMPSGGATLCVAPAHHQARAGVGARALSHVGRQRAALPALDRQPAGTAQRVGAAPA